MYSIPMIIPLEEDELLGSWMYRLSKANLFENSDSFLRSFVRAISDSGYQYIKYNDTEEFHAFYLALQSSTPMAELYLKTTCYAGLAPFITSGQQTRRINLAFRKTYGHPEFTPKVTPLTAKLCYCRECRSEELRRQGFWYYHRAHQLPGVKVCHKHGCLLNIFNGKIGHEFDDDFIFHSTLFIDENEEIVKEMFENLKEFDISDDIKIDSIIMGKSDDGINFHPILDEVIKE